MEAAAEGVFRGHTVTEHSQMPVCFKIARKHQDRPWKLWFIYLHCYFLTIATILGTGILGLPVTIARAGFWPFMVSFLSGFFMQALLIYLFVDLLQRCRVAQMESVKSTETEEILIQDISPVEPTAPDTEEGEEGEDVEEADAGLLQKEGTALKTQEELQPNLHVLGVLFLGKHCSRAFNFILLFHFVSIGISYVLAGSEAYAALLHTSHVYVIPAFTWMLSLGILLAQVVIQPITSVLTLFKGVILIITVAMTFVVGSEVHQETMNDFTQIGKPFLMGTVALGGIVNVMPLLFSEISHNKTQIIWFRRSVLGGLATCTVLNVLWCWAVLEIVPQMAVRSILEESLLNTSTLQTETTLRTHTFVYSNISLEDSEKAGEIATIPLTKLLERHQQVCMPMEARFYSRHVESIITQKYRCFAWVANLIQIFITISITVSFLVMGSAMKHTIDGLISNYWKANAELMVRFRARTLPQSFQGCSVRSAASGFVSFLAFGVIFIVSACDPKGFVIMLDKVVSFSLNTEVGLFIFLMLRSSRSERFKHLTVPVPVAKGLFRLHWLLPVYFLFAVAYDISQSLLDLSRNMSRSPHANASLL